MDLHKSNVCEVEAVLVINWVSGEMFCLILSDLNRKFCFNKSN